MFPKPQAGYHLDTSSELVRFANIDEGPDPCDLQIAWLPEGEDPIRVPCPIEPERYRGYSLCEEPSIALLPDGWLFLVVRTVTGRIWYTVSDNDGGGAGAPPKCYAIKTPAKRSYTQNLHARSMRCRMADSCFFFITTMVSATGPLVHGI